ncbi:pimeloyl-ACP methyl ester carboxylesterase [Saccharothrix carnea]|uniref:Pimeloyl-ACP methyl ester carboxylesterase n=1 Tax=Saccharothrix carnea TaxID=1280637 RepID=A0A2P8IF11_SACCR|nr:alpha/beta hydrolase [Saccharothrix carnea]PSL57042.1 pimeloyl-ACP methyl ester carboxylesterase [Saccharothrix carnea]
MQDRAVGAAGRIVPANGVDLCVETFGDSRHPALLLIMGLGFQLVHWPDEFCRRLAGHGFFVIRFDNRDAGRSTHLPGADYSLADMAADAVGLLDALGVGRAHVVGASMGGMIAQLMAALHPSRVLSLASLMSTTGRRGKGRTSPRLVRHLFSRGARTEQEAVERRVRLFGTIGSSGFEQDVDEIRRATALAFRRDPDHRGGRRRQYRAVRVAGDRTDQLARITAPTVVIHGTADRMCHHSGGEATAAAISGARLQLIPGLGHDLPPGAWPTIIDAIVANAHRTQP